MAFDSGPADVQQQLPRIKTPLPNDRVAAELKEIGAEARDASARLSRLISTQHVVIAKQHAHVAQRQAEATERFQRKLTLVGTAVLVPGLIAAIFGANVGFRGRDQLEGFWAMLLFMVAGGFGLYALLRSAEGDAWSRLARRLGLSSTGPASNSCRLLILALISLLAAVAGLVVLSMSP